MRDSHIDIDAQLGIADACPQCLNVDCVFRTLARMSARRDNLSLSRGERLECGAEVGCMKFWIVLEGLAASCVAFEDGRRQIVSLEAGGAIVCAPMGRPKRAAWLQALSDCEICILDLSAQAEVLRTDADFLKAVFKLVHDRLSRSEDHVATLGRLDSRERVTLFLARAAASQPRALINLAMSREDMADYLGLNAETVSRVLTQLRKSGLVKFLTRSEFIVPDLNALARRLPVPVDHPAEEIRNP